MSQLGGAFLRGRSGSARAERVERIEKTGSVSLVGVRARGTQGQGPQRRRSGHGLYCTVAMVIVALGHAPATRGQCAFDWRPGEGYPGVEGSVHATTHWDPDGLGSQQEMLIAGGYFWKAGKVAANSVAAWDGQSWHALGNTREDGWAYDLSVEALSVYQGKLIVAGTFGYVGGMPAYGIIEYDGTTWRSLGDGADADVRAMCVYEGKLIAGGYFNEIGGIPANNIAQWDGQAWQPLGEGTGGTRPDVCSLTVYEDKLVASGEFTRAGNANAIAIAQWDGQRWDTLGSGLAGIADYGPVVLSLTVYRDELVATGGFVIGGTSVESTVAKWDGQTWEPLDTQLLSDYYVVAWSSTVFNDTLIIAGSIGSHGQNDSNNYVFQWDGSSWRRLDPVTSNFDIYAVDSYEDRLIACGDFGVVQWDGNAWGYLYGGLSDAISAMTVFQGNLVVAGPFAFAGLVNVHRIAQFDGASWQALGTGIADFNREDGGNRNGIPPVGISALEKYDGKLIAGGYFPIAGGQFVNHIAEWDGKSWQSLGSGVSNKVFALTIYDGKLIAGGSFTSAGGVTANHIAIWDGESWQPLGSGVSSTVTALGVYHGLLIVGGNFTTAGGVSVNHIAQWDGESWQALGGGINGDVYQIVAYQDNFLIVGGNFSRAGSETAYDVARWDGANWQSFGNVGLENVRSFAVFDGDLFAGGYRSYNSATAAARWDGLNWQRVEVNGDVKAMVNYGGTLVVGGIIYSTDDNGSVFFARWGPTCKPGDMNCDGVVDKFDLYPFADALLDPGSDTDCVRYLANVNGDVEADGASKVDGADIAPFITTLMDGK